MKPPLDCPNWYSAQSRGFSTNYGAFRIGKPTASHPAPHYGMEGNDDWKQAWDALYPGVQIMSGCAALSAMMRIWEKITATFVTQWEDSLAAGHDGWADLIGENPGLTEHPQLVAWKSHEEKNRTQSGKKRSASKRGRPRGSGNPYSTIIAAAIGIHENARAAGQRMTQCQAVAQAEQDFPWMPRYEAKDDPWKVKEAFKEFRGKLPARGKPRPSKS